MLCRCCFEVVLFRDVVLVVPYESCNISGVLFLFFILFPYFGVVGLFGVRSIQGFYPCGPKFGRSAGKSDSTGFSVNTNEWIGACPFTAASGIPFSLYQYRRIDRGIVDRGNGGSVALV